MTAGDEPRGRAQALGLAVALGLGTAVSLGLARFSYALFLPPMRADLGWSYFTSGLMNTANAAGYLVGALATPASLRAVGARATLLTGMVLTGVLLAANGTVTSDTAIFTLRALAGVTSAFAFVAGGLLASHLAGTVSVADGRPAASAGLVLGLFYGSTGLGIVASALSVPWLANRAVAHAWQGGWLALGVLALAATAATTWATRRSPPVGRARRSVAASAGDSAAASATGFALRPFLAALVAYLLFGLGYIGYMTFIVTLLREQQLSADLIVAFFAALGAAVVASPWLWAGVLQRFRGGETLSLLSGLLALATLLPVLSPHPLAVFASGLLFGACFLSLVASTTALVRHNLPAPAWPAGISTFTIVFAAGQIVGPSLVGTIADHSGGLRGGLACSAALLALAALIAWQQKPLPAAG